MANENSTPKPPPWFFFNPSDTRVIQTFLIPRIRQQDLPLNDFSQRDLFASLPWLLAGQEGYSEEKPEIYFFNQTRRMTPQWIPICNSEVLIRRGDTVIGRKQKFRHASNSKSNSKSSKKVEWYLDQYTAEGENSDEAVYKLYTGINPAVHLYPSEAKNLILAVPPPNSGSSSLPVHPNPPPQQASSQWNPLLLQHSGSSSLLQQASLPWNTESLQASSQRNPSQLGLNGSSALPLPQGNLTSLQQDNTQTGLQTDWSGSGLLQEIVYSSQLRYQNPNALPQGNPPSPQQDNAQTGPPTVWSAHDNQPTSQNPHPGLQ